MTTGAAGGFVIPINVADRFTAQVAQTLRREIDGAGGNEIFAVGCCEESACVAEIAVASRGHESAVPVVASYAEAGDVLIHNHPSGTLSPSDADLDVASRYAEAGVGFYIVDNAVNHVYVVVEPTKRREIRPLDIVSLETMLLPGGRVSRMLPRYESRPQQVEMMRAVAAAFNESEIVVVEAGTGVGKSLAYLMPAFAWAEANEERVVVSTATINLQHQLVDKDIPLLLRITGSRVKAALVKGRGNYLCLRRLNEVEEEYGLFAEDRKEVSVIREWAADTATGERGDLSVHVTDETWMRVCSESDGCHGLRCVFRGDCFVYRARKEAALAQILVTNHHLLFSDLAIRRSGIGRDGTAVLPPFRHIIFDEAHNIEKNATSFFSTSYDRSALNRSLSRLHRTRSGKETGSLHRLESLLAPDGRSATEAIYAGIEEVGRLADEVDSLALAAISDPTLRLRENDPSPEISAAVGRLGDLKAVLVQTIERVQQLVGRIPEERLEEECVTEAGVALRRLEHFASMIDGVLHQFEHRDRVFWIERRTTKRLGAVATFHSTPLDVREVMRETVFEPYDTVVCTSATLTIRKRFDFFADRLGLLHFEAKRPKYFRLDSPFDYRRRVLLSAIVDAPAPQEGRYQEFVEETVRTVLEVSEGRGLVLFTSYRMLERTYREVSPVLGRLGISVLRQGTADRSRLLDRFTSEATSVLFATDSFWEGVDAPGDALRVVIVCRLPFRVPNDPVFEAKVEAIEREGGNAFVELSLPEAVMRLRQGFGRLIRRATDRGVVVVLDPRIVQKRYGALFIESLPETARSFANRRRVMEDIERFLYT